MEMIQVWHVYIILGLALCAAELIMPAIMLLPIGLGALATVPFASFVPFWMSLVLWGIFSLLFFILLRRWFAPKKDKSGQTGASGMVGVRVMLTKASSPQDEGELKLYGDTWKVIQGDETIKDGEWVEITEVIGNRVKVRQTE